MLIISQVDFGILFDIDGVIGRGAKPLAAAQRMIKLLTDKDGKQIVPLAFCTNSTGAAADKAKTLTNWLDIEVRDIVFVFVGPNYCYSFQYSCVSSTKIWELYVIRTVGTSVYNKQLPLVVVL